MSLKGSNVTIRQATPEDVDALVTFQLAMAQETEGKGLDPDLLRAGVAAVFQSTDKGFYIVAEMEGRSVAGLLVTYEWSDWRNATFWWIQSVYVDQASRRRGVYRAMHDHIFSAAKSREDVCGVRLYVERTNLVAQQTYVSLDMAKSHYDLYEVDFIPFGAEPS